MQPEPLQAHHVDPSTEGQLSIWFFVGVLMLSCGLIILGQGIYEFSHPGITVLAKPAPGLLVARGC